MLDETAHCVRKFAMCVAELYLARTALDLRHVKFRWGVSIDELCRAERHNAQILGRYMDGTVKVLPADLEDAWILAMPEPYRGELERELAARRGHLAVAQPDPAVAQVVGVAGMTKEFAELLAAIAPALADGVINEADRPMLRRVIAEGNDLIAAVLGVRLHAESLLEPPGRDGRHGR
jgi:hypothetical protein